ncbi:MAG: LysM peptidoglycan-binding domain-containing protein [Methylococcales bacterium]|jgi:hypothetical protein|nr:LysM peptidoglycan-binding domain-containing protein [Methylococcales bacterium]MBT7442743.1 LysM peptidoglycan-binding domain-containing protein [Methylococcales bacterium]
MIRKTLWSMVLACAITLPASNAFADSVELNPNHPQRYTVVKGDTLWGISERFLNDAWRWPDVWHVNQHIKNPHLIYPGDEIELTYVDGEPQLRLHRGGNNGVVKLSPHIRESELDTAIPTIPLDAIKQFLLHPEVMNADEMDSAPYVVAFPGTRQLAGSGDRAYVRTIETKQTKNFVIFEPGNALIDPDTKEILGYEAHYRGDAKLQKAGDPATVKIIRSVQEVSVGDRLRPSTNEEVMTHFQPHAPKEKINGYIIGVTDGVVNIGQFNTVVINKGTADNIEVGHIFNVWQRGDVISDVVSKNPHDKVQLPDEKAGYLMVYKTFDRVSYALVMKAVLEMQTLDKISTP